VTGVKKSDETCKKRTEAGGSIENDGVDKKEGSLPFPLDLVLESVGLAVPFVARVSFRITDVD
jgi:hypothetical protein